jgi:hypothetical protein
MSSSLLSKNVKIKTCTYFILHVVLYGWGTWSLMPREVHRMRVFENRMLRKIFEPMCDGVTGEWRRLRIEERHDMYTSPNIILASTQKRR